MFPEAFLNKASQKAFHLAVQGHVPGAVDIAYLSRASILLTVLFFSYATSFPQIIYTQAQKYPKVQVFNPLLHTEIHVFFSSM